MNWDIVTTEEQLDGQRILGVSGNNTRFLFPNRKSKSEKYSIMDMITQKLWGPKDDEDGAQG